MPEIGLQLSNSSISYEWDDFDKLTKVSSSSGGIPTDTVRQQNRYNVNGLRKKKLDRNGNSSQEYSAGITAVSSKKNASKSAVPTLSYIMGHQILGYEEHDGVFRHFLTDALGTVRDVVDDNGDVIQSYEFNEHGIPMPGSGAETGTFAPKTYQGALSVNDDRNDSGLYLMGHRHYAPDLGRFISRDPIGFAGGLNLFNGASTSPVTFTDAAGLNPRPCTSDEMGTFSDALGLLTRLSRGSGHTKYRNAATSLSSLDIGGLIRINDPLVTDLGETRRGLQIGNHGINLSSSLFFSGPFQRLCKFPEQRFDRAVLLAGVLFHEDWHWNNFSNYDSREKAAWQQELGFYRDLLLYEMKEGGSQSRLDTIWQIGADRLAAGRSAGHVPATGNFFDHRSQVLGP